MNKFFKNIAFFAFVLLLIPFASVLAMLQYEYSFNIPKTNERELNVRIESSLNKVVISKGDTRKAFSIIYNNKVEEYPNAKVSYKVIDNIGYLNIKINDDNDHVQSWFLNYNPSSSYQQEVFYISLNNNVPIKFDLHLGAGYSKLDMSGLLIKDLKLEAGAAETLIFCNEENPIDLETIKIDAGLSKFRAYKLGNTNFKRLYFEGGVGSYYFDFTGSLRNEAYVSMELGLGSLSINIPETVGTSVFYDKGFLSSFDYGNFKKIGESKYINNNFTDGNRKLNIKLESGLGSVKIKSSR